MIGHNRDKRDFDIIMKALAPVESYRTRHPSDGICRIIRDIVVDCERKGKMDTIKDEITTACFTAQERHWLR